MGTSPNSPQGKSTLSAIGSELKANPPAIENATRRKFGVQRAKAQNTAILLSKARKAGVNVPNYSAKKMSGNNNA